VALSPSKVASVATKKLEAKALAADSKSEGMRLLYDADYSVTQVAKVFGVSYGFAYGVASRAGKVETAAARRAPKREKPAAAASKPKAAALKRVPATKAPVATVKKVASGGKPVAAKARVTSLAAAKPALAKKPGRPSAARRAVNRKVAVTA
jgi:transposase